MSIITTGEHDEGRHDNVHCDEAAIQTGGFYKLLSPFSVKDLSSYASLPLILGNI